MENKELYKKWPDLKKQLLEKYPDLTEEDLVLEIGKEEETLLRLQNKAGKNWKEIKNILSLMG